MFLGCDKMIISIGCDHWGVEMKNYIIMNLQKRGLVINNYGPTEKSDKKVDFVDYAIRVGEDIKKNNADFGILICRTGVGMAIACNKVKSVRCAKVDSEAEAILSRTDDNANVIALSSEKDNEEALKMVEAFLKAKFSLEERYIKRINKIKEYENGSHGIL